MPEGEEDDKDSDKSSSDGDTRDEVPSKAPRPREVADRSLAEDPKDFLSGQDVSAKWIAGSQSGHFFSATS